jgi:peptidylprolyl isomerase
MRSLFFGWERKPRFYLLNSVVKNWPDANTCIRKNTKRNIFLYIFGRKTTEMDFRKGIYRHFKGQFYEVLDLARHSETEELFVVYRPLYGEGGTWIRPAEMFFDFVKREGKTQPRFTYIADRCDFSGDNNPRPKKQLTNAIYHLTPKKDNPMTQAKRGDRVKVHLTGTLQDGTVFDSTADGFHMEEAGPVELTLGEEEVFAEIEEALIGMAPGDKKTILITVDNAFGPYEEENVFTFGLDQLPAEPLPELGQEVELTDEEGESMVATVVEINDEDITFDANHPLAGENLNYEIELVEIL